MNSNQSANLTSLKLIVSEAKANASDVALIPAFAAKITELDNITIQIDALHVLQNQDISGVTESKNTLEETLFDYIEDVSGAVYSYAIEQGDITLQAKVNFKRWQLDRMDKAEITATATLVLTEAKNIPVTVMADYGISADELTSFETSITNYKASSSNPRVAIIDRSGYTKKLADLFEKAANIKKNSLDRLAVQFIRKAPAFYQKYKAASVVIYKSGKTTSTDSTQDTSGTQASSAS